MAAQNQFLYGHHDACSSKSVVSKFWSVISGLLTGVAILVVLQKLALFSLRPRFMSLVLEPDTLHGLNAPASNNLRIANMTTDNVISCYAHSKRNWTNYLRTHYRDTYTGTFGQPTRLWHVCAWVVLSSSLWARHFASLLKFR